MASERRVEQINNLIREELGKILDREIEIPGGALITITRVDTSSDVHYATAYLSILGARAEAFAAIEKDIYHIQQQLNRTLEMRPVPKLRFSLDKEEERREGVERSLAKLKQEGEL